MFNRYENKILAKHTIRVKLKIDIVLIKLQELHKLWENNLYIQIIDSLLVSHDCETTKPTDPMPGYKRNLVSRVVSHDQFYNENNIKPKLIYYNSKWTKHNDMVNATLPLIFNTLPREVFTCWVLLISSCIVLLKLMCQFSYLRLLFFLSLHALCELFNLQ